MSKRLNIHKNIIIELKDGEQFCTKCNGKGVVLNRLRCSPRTMAKYLTCNICLGDGKIDWVEKAVGKNYLRAENE